ncbi:unnamed protein product [Polarella glacialis]|uniref:Uncharacterized protein n=1 Tax=Polarella glacialis TaxID=89957 RepID=A0A813HR74_POLGL|nr:unnamed protein product [Polarella glacialis]
MELCSDALTVPMPGLNPRRRRLFAKGRRQWTTTTNNNRHSHNNNNSNDDNNNNNNDDVKVKVKVNTTRNSPGKLRLPGLRRPPSHHRKANPPVGVQTGQTALDAKHPEEPGRIGETQHGREGREGKGREGGEERGREGRGDDVEGGQALDCNHGSNEREPT